MLYTPSEWNQRLWKLRILGKDVYGKSKGWGHTQSQVRRIGNMLNTVRLMGRVSGSRKSLETQGREQTGDVFMRDSAENGGTMLLRRE